MEYGDAGADDDRAGLGEQMVMRPVARMKGPQCAAAGVCSQLQLLPSLTKGRESQRSSGGKTNVNASLGSTWVLISRGSLLELLCTFGCHESSVH